MKTLYFGQWVNHQMFVYFFVLFRFFVGLIWTWLFFPIYLHRPTSVGAQLAKFREGSEERQLRDWGRGGDKTVPRSGSERLPKAKTGTERYSFSPDGVSQLAIRPLSLLSWSGNVTRAIAFGHGFHQTRAMNGKSLTSFSILCSGHPVSEMVPQLLQHTNHYLILQIL